MKVLFIGLGGIGQRHLRNLIQINKKIDLYAYRVLKNDIEVDNQLNATKSVNIEKKYNIKLIKSLNEINKIKPEITFICNPSSMHIKSSIVAARSGSNIFIEKPLSNSFIGIDELKKILRAKKNHAYVGYQLRFNPVIKKLKKIVDKKIIGNIVSVRSEVTEYMPGFHKYENYKKSYASLKKLGGGVILTQIHEIDYLQWIFGPPKNIYALGGKLSNLEIDVEDSASLLMSCDKGGVSIPINLYIDFLQKNNRRNCIVYGTKGRIEADLKNLSLELIQDNKLIKKFSWKSFDRNQQFIQQLKHFLKVVENKEKPLVDFNEGLKSLKIALAAKKSINTGKIIKIKY